MIKLRDIPVTFDADSHTYNNTETGVMLQGITQTLLHKIFPDKYAGIPQHILEAAAAKGTAVHNDIEIAEELETEFTTRQGENYRQMKESEHLVFLTSEYLVSDLEHFASKIDLVFHGSEGGVLLADIKTTQKFDAESVSWQLSIYAYFFHLANPDVKVEKLYGIWVREEFCELIEVKMHTEEEVQALIEAYLNDQPFEVESNTPDYIAEVTPILRSLKSRIDALTEEYDAIKDILLKKMVEVGDKTAECDGVKITYVPPTERKSFDGKAFQKDNKELYDKYIRLTSTNPQLRITIKTDNNGK